MTPTSGRRGPARRAMSLKEFWTNVRTGARPDRYADADALLIGKRIEARLAPQLPQPVQEIRFETGPDATGDPAVWIWVVLSDDVGEEEVFLPAARKVRELLEAIVEELGIP